jgi:hypothetical protein
MVSDVVPIKNQAQYATKARIVHPEDALGGYVVALMQIHYAWSVPVKGCVLDVETGPFWKTANVSLS